MAFCTLPFLKNPTACSLIGFSALEPRNGTFLTTNVSSVTSSRIDCQYWDTCPSLTPDTFAKITGMFTVSSTTLKFGLYRTSSSHKIRISSYMVCRTTTFAFPYCCSRYMPESWYMTVSSSRSAWYAAVPMCTPASSRGNSRTAIVFS